MTLESFTRIHSRGTLADIPPRPSIVAQIEAVSSAAQAIAAEKARAAKMVADRNAAIHEGRVAKAANHIEDVRKMLRKRNGWMRIADMVAELKTKRGADVHPVDLGKALRRTPGFEWKEIHGRVCWRVADGSIRN